MSDKSTLIERVSALVATTLEVPLDEINESTCAANTPVWDSLAHLMIINAVERDFKIKLPRLESYTVKNVGELAALVGRQLSAT